MHGCTHSNAGLGPVEESGHCHKHNYSLLVLGLSSVCLCVCVCVRERRIARENVCEHLRHNILWGWRGGGASLTWRYDFPCCAAQEQEAIKFNVTLPRLATDAFYVGVSLWEFLTTVRESGEGMLFQLTHTRTHTHTHTGSAFIGKISDGMPKVKGHCF